MQSSGASAQSTFENALKNARGQSKNLASDIESLITSYNDGRQKIVATAVNNANSAGKKGGDWKTQTIDGGWPLLGTIFWQINTNQASINSLAQLMIATSNDPQIDKEWSQDQRFQELAERVAAIKKAYSASGASILQASATSANETIPSLSGITLAGSDGDFFDKAKMLLYSGLSSITKLALSRNSPDDLIINIQWMGSAIGTGAEAFYLSKALNLSGIRFSADMAIAAGEVVDSNVVNKILPTGMAAKAIGGLGQITNGMLRSMNEYILPMVDELLMILVGVGFIAGVLLPTIPLSIWFMGVISWMLFYIECLLVSPFWLAAHGTAEKEGWGSEHTRQGYMLMLGLYLNPILRVAGFFAIFIALKPAAYLVYWFFDYVHGVLASGFVLLFASVGAVCVSIMFAYSLIVRVFTLPSELFERGLRWVNGGHEVTGDSHNEEGARRNFMAFVSKGEHLGARRIPGGKPNPGKQPGKDGETNKKVDD
jgi:conjugal transfer/type IV secretion protein DotA/TraY